MDGQLSIFDYLDTKAVPTMRSDILLKAGQVIYEVLRGDAKEWTVLAESWELEIGNRGYRLYDGIGYGVAWNESLGAKHFTNRETATEKAEEFLKTHDVILAEKIKPISTVAYQYVRDADNRTMTAFYCELENDLYYIKEFMIYHHITDKKGLKKFMEQQEFKYCKLEQIEYQPTFKNMYRRNEQSDWLYAEAGYSYATG